MAQLCLDGQYRTITGFITLLEKEWIKFGYKFSHRSGHLNNVEDVQKNWDASKMFGAATKFLGSTFNTANTSSGTSSETWTPNNEKPKEFSPIFSQFLDCVYQLWTQFPNFFEFDERLLGLLNRAVYSCEFGTFLTNCEKERLDFKIGGKSITESTPSLWDYINSNKLLYVNDIYSNSNDVLVARVENLKYWKYVYYDACGALDIFNTNDRDSTASAPKNRQHDLSMESMSELVQKVNSIDIKPAANRLSTGSEQSMPIVAGPQPMEFKEVTDIIAVEHPLAANTAPNTTIGPVLDNPWA